MSGPLLLNQFNIELARYLATHRDRIPAAIVVNPNSYLRTKYGRAISDYEGRPKNYTEKFEVDIEFVDNGDEYFRYEIVYSLQHGILDALLIDSKT